MKLADISGESDGAIVLYVGENSVDLWLERSSKWYVSKVKCKKCINKVLRAHGRASSDFLDRQLERITAFSLVTRNGKTEKFACAKSIQTCEIAADGSVSTKRRACGSKEYEVLSTEYTGVSARQAFTFDKYFKERFAIKEDISTEGLKRWEKQTKEKIKQWCKEALMA